MGTFLNNTDTVQEKNEHKSEAGAVNARPRASGPGDAKRQESGGVMLALLYVIPFNFSDWQSRGLAILQTGNLAARRFPAQLSCLSVGLCAIERV